MDRVGLFIGRLQPLHKGHTKIINQMIEDCKTVIIGVGSVQKNKEKHDPWNVEERKSMLRNVYSDRIKIVPLKDLGTEPGKDAWVDYVLDKIKKLGLPEPTDYYTGSESDGVWYESRFWKGDPEDPEARFDPWYKGVRTKYGTGTVRRLNIIERTYNEVPSASELRGFMELRNPGWKKWVPAVNHEIVEQGYPEEFKVPK